MGCLKGCGQLLQLFHPVLCGISLPLQLFLTLADIFQRSIFLLKIRKILPGFRTLAPICFQLLFPFSDSRSRFPDLLLQCRQRRITRILRLCLCLLIGKLFHFRKLRCSRFKGNFQLLVVLAFLYERIPDFCQRLLRFLPGLQDAKLSVDLRQLPFRFCNRFLCSRQLPFVPFQQTTEHRHDLSHRQHPLPGLFHFYAQNVIFIT